MRYAEYIDGPLIVKNKDGDELEVIYEDGGGMFLGEDSYEIHFVDHKGNTRVAHQDEIESVHIKATGEEVEFGNPYMPGHPRPKELPWKKESHLE